MRLSLILEAIDRASRPTERVDAAVTGLGRASRRSALDMRSLDQRMDGAERSANRLDRAARRIGTGFVSTSRRSIGALAALDRRIQFSQAQMEKLAYRAGGMIGSSLRTGLMAGTALAGAGLSAALYKVVTAGLTFEKFRVQLEGLEGSAAAGERALNWVSDFAARTPYELNDVMEAFIALKAYGIDPTDGTLRSLGDTAAGMGKSLMQAVEMIADAQTGEFERIKEFGIKAAVQGDKVTFRWQRNGKEMSKMVRQTSTEIRTALLGIMDQRFAGGMERLAKTTEGKWSNLMDGMGRIANRVWEGGFGAQVNKQIDRINDSLGQMEKDGSLQRWAENTGKGLGELIDVVGSTDWRGIAGGIRDVGSAVSTLAGALRELDEKGGKVRKFVGDAENLWGYRDALGSVEWNSTTNPFQLKYHAPSWAKPKAAPAPKPSGVPFMDAAPAQPANRPPRRSPARSSGVPFIDASRPQAQAAPNAKVELTIKTPAGTTAKPTKLSAAGIDVEVNTGRQMAGAA
ncbi:tape measure protein [Sphingobium sp. WTD-1]|uniref:tape measure protein n=1 Tax=Sphingobium sp. WTD-1 TaxID=2979467 RepID=UPI0024DECA6F|nr:tape measure protein [Sphingobium sp. WTD-1]WIA55472.1 tape measure protein [Sphingobium sp. WTD-1]WIA56591.1 tape measure protein [Sphingobium sp. WTD-1]